MIEWPRTVFDFPSRRLPGRLFGFSKECKVKPCRAIRKSWTLCNRFSKECKVKPCQVGSWEHGHGALRTTALAVGPFVGQGCERSELPCLSFGGVELGRRSWSFLHLNHRFLRESLFSIVACVPHASKTIDNSSGSPFIHSNIHHKRKKKTKTFGLAFSVTGQAG